MGFIAYGKHHGKGKRGRNRWRSRTLVLSLRLTAKTDSLRLTLSVD